LTRRISVVPGAGRSAVVTCWPWARPDTHRARPSAYPVIRYMGCSCCSLLSITDRDRVCSANPRSLARAVPHLPTAGHRGLGMGENLDPDDLPGHGLRKCGRKISAKQIVEGDAGDLLAIEHQK